MQLTASSTQEYSRDGHVISLTDEAFDLLGSFANARKRVATSDPGHGYDVEEIRESLVRGQVVRSAGVELRDRVSNAGMIELLSYVASCQGFDLQGRAQTQINTLPAPSHSDGLSYQTLPRFLADHPRGLIRIACSCSPAEVVADVRAAFPDRRILVLGRVEPLKTLQCLLPNLLKLRMPFAEERVDLVSDGRRLQIQDGDDFPMLLLSTPVAAADLDTEKCDIVILLDALHCTHRIMQDVLAQVDARFRLFGILNANRKLKSYERARLHQVFGFNEINLMSRGRIRRPVQYAMVRQAGNAPKDSVWMKPAVPGRRPVPTVNSLAAYTHNHSRNDSICRLAKGLCFGGELSNKRYRDFRRWSRDRAGNPLSVTIAVDRLDHAIQLGKRLPDWPIIARKDNNLHGIGSGMRHRIKTDKNQWLAGDGQIVAADAAQRFDGRHSDVLIWASGGTTAESIPASWMFSQSNPDRPMLIVDFLDDFAQAAKDWSIRRFRHLEARDIFRVGTPASIGRIERFLRAEGGQR